MQENINEGHVFEWSRLNFDCCLGVEERKTCGIGIQQNRLVAVIDPINNILKAKALNDILGLATALAPRLVNINQLQLAFEDIECANRPCHAPSLDLIELRLPPSFELEVSTIHTEGNRALLLLQRYCDEGLEASLRVTNVLLPLIDQLFAVEANYQRGRSFLGLK